MSHVTYELEMEHERWKRTKIGGVNLQKLEAKKSQQNLHNNIIVEREKNDSKEKKW